MAIPPGRPGRSRQGGSSGSVSWLLNPDPMGDYELVITRTKRLEALLERDFSARGRGLHERVSSVQERLPDATIKRLRFIATVRNKLIHEPDYRRLDDRRGFVRACREAERELHRLRPGRRRRSLWKVLGFLVLAALGVLLLRLLGLL